jgi:hypothetical protein
VKSLLVRARVGLVEAQESRDADCGEIRRDLLGSYDRGVKASGRARRHMRECAACRDYRNALRGMRRSFAALAPAGAGPAALIAKLVGVGGAGGGAAAAGGGGGAVVAGGAATVTACKVAAVVCATAITAGGAVEVRKLTHAPPPKRERTAAPRVAAAPVALVRPAAAPPVHRVPIAPAPALHAPAAPAAAPRPAPAADRRELDTGAITAPEPLAQPVTGQDEAPVLVDSKPQASSGGTAAPEDEADESAAAVPPAGGTAPPERDEAAADAQPPASQPAVAEPATTPAAPTGTVSPPQEH